MKITIYELIGMIKDGKAPDKIKYLDKYYTYVKEDYEDEEENQLLSWLFQDYCVEYVLNAEVSIPIVESKKDKIEKIEMIGCNMKVNIIGKETLLPTENLQIEFIINKINEIIEVLNENNRFIK